MKILIVAAMDNEISVIKDKLKLNNDFTEKEIEGFVFYFGHLYDKQIILVKSGVGRVNAAILIALAKLSFDFDLVINIGIAGGLNDLSVYDIVVGKNTVYGDVDLSVFSEKYVYGQMSNCPRYFEGSKRLIDLIESDDDLKDVNIATICSCEKFTSSDKEARELINNHFSNLNVLAFDMESACYAQACNRFNIEFLAIRFISDIIGSEAQADYFLKNEDLAAKSLKCNNYILKLIERI